MKYRTCPDCGANLDFGETCECAKKNETDAPTTTRQPRNPKGLPQNKIPSDWEDVKTLCNLRKILMQTNATNKDVAAAVQDIFPRFNRQLLTQATNWETYGVLIHPMALAYICSSFGIESAAADAKAGKPRKQSRRLGKQLTFRCTETFYEEMLTAMDACGFSTVQGFIENIVTLYLGRLNNGERI